MKAIGPCVRLKHGANNSLRTLHSVSDSSVLSDVWSASFMFYLFIYLCVCVCVCVSLSAHVSLLFTIILSVIFTALTNPGLVGYYSVIFKCY